MDKKQLKRFPRQVNGLPIELTVSRDCSGPGYEITSEDYTEKFRSAHDVEQIFKIYGSNLVALTLHGAADVVIMMAAKHCVAGTLKKLSISSLTIIKDLVVELEPLFRQIEKLSVLDAAINCGPNLFRDFDSLVELRVFNKLPQRYEFKEIVENYFPKLQRFSFGDQCNGCHSVVKLDFIGRHQNLKFLHFPIHQHQTTDDFLGELGNVCKDLKKLEELDIYVCHCCRKQKTTLDFPNFQSLTRLQLDCGYSKKKTAIVRLKKLEALEVLKVCGKFDSNDFLETLPFLKNLRELYVQLNRTTEKFSSLPQLTKLSISSDSKAIDNVVDTIRGLANLEELDILSTKFVLNEKEYREIVEVAKERSKTLTLICKHEFDEETTVKIEK